MRNRSALGNNEFPDENSPEFDLRHHLYDTLILLGARREIAELVERSMDNAVTCSDVDALRKYNAELITRLKSRLAHIHTTKIRASSEALKRNASDYKFRFDQTKRVCIRRRLLGHLCFCCGHYTAEICSAPDHTCRTFERAPQPTQCSGNGSRDNN